MSTIKSERKTERKKGDGDRKRKTKREGEWWREVEKQRYFRDEATVNSQVQKPTPKMKTRLRQRLSLTSRSVTQTNLCMRSNSVV